MFGAALISITENNGYKAVVSVPTVILISYVGLGDSAKPL